MICLRQVLRKCPLKAIRQCKCCYHIHTRGVWHAWVRVTYIHVPGFPIERAGLIFIALLHLSSWLSSHPNRLSLFRTCRLLSSPNSVAQSLVVFFFFNFYLIGLSIIYDPSWRVRRKRSSHSCFTTRGNPGRGRLEGFIPFKHRAVILSF